MLRQISSDDVLTSNIKRWEKSALRALINSLHDKLNFSYFAISGRVVAEGKICCNPTSVAHKVSAVGH